ncbi:protein SENESCENCE-ASSOCIATED GENE 21, mitochondrial [Punica granatum]|uniref:Uncharacterized protein n=2 Tax=Punica granatum TaxID=22663 RepID=A0A218WZY1_PUNGR|nr:protein SENESCENCE-ASSOCIATED GENE 21, mitochondrial [Punica granatum]OWM78086.1 hypothetical protein CDL15_Pgr018655 [Punica granatum]PKI51653.1 hypothetical protein CRG98_027955 [Punica granatum]
MARSLSSAKLLSAAVVDGVASSIKRRGFSAAASQGVVRTGGGSSPVMTKKAGEEKAGAAAHKVSWAPDPKTGYYRPEIGAEEIDVAELRAARLKQKN